MTKKTLAHGAQYYQEQICVIIHDFEKVNNSRAFQK